MSAEMAGVLRGGKAWEGRVKSGQAARWLPRGKIKVTGLGGPQCTWTEVGDSGAVAYKANETGLGQADVGGCVCEWISRDVGHEVGDPGGGARWVCWGAGVRVRLRFLRQPRGSTEGADEHPRPKGGRGLHSSAVPSQGLFRDRSQDVAPLSPQHPLLRNLLTTSL